MGRVKRRKRKSRQAGMVPGSKKLINIVLLGLTGAAIVVLVVISTKPDLLAGKTPRHDGVRSSGQTAITPTTLVTSFDFEPQTLNELLDLSPAQLEKVDMARMNLLCATRLPSTKGLDVEHALTVLDQWARKVAFETQRHLYRVTDPRYADYYGHSEAQLRAEMLAQVLQEDLGVKYDMSAVGNFSFADPNVAFIHGMIPGPGQTTADTPGGTCASMPVLFVAVGRRLGYPLKLSTTDSHIFARWDGARHANPAWRERFNCEATNGFGRYDDDYYRTWPKPVTQRQVAVNGFLKSLTPAEELAQFLAARGHHAMDVGQFAFAARCYENAYRYDTRRPCYRSWFMGAASRGDYRPSTPALHQMIAARKARLAAARNHRRRPDVFGSPLPSQTRMETLPGMPHQPSPFGAQPGLVHPLSQSPSPTTVHDPLQAPR